MLWTMWRRSIFRTIGIGGVAQSVSPAGISLRQLSSSTRRFAALWGNGDFGRLGLGNLESKWKPTMCPFFEDDPPIAISCGGAHTLFLTESGRVYATGLNNFGQLGTTTAKTHVPEPFHISGLADKVVQISAGYHHSAAVTEDGKLFVWGKNSCGQLGLGKRAKSVVSTPTRVDSLDGIYIKMVSLGSEHSIAVTADGNVLSWGSGVSGKLGHGHQSSILGFSFSSSEYMPRLIRNFEGLKIKKVSAGMLHSACIDERGSVFVFGEKAVGVLGFSEGKKVSEPSAVEKLPLSEEVACGGYHTCIVTNDGKLYAWGSNENGCLGLGCTDVIRLPQIVESSFLKAPVSEVSCGWKHTAVVSDGNIFTWGWGGANGSFFEEEHSSGGQLGHGNDFDYSQPMLLNLGRNVQALHVSCGFNHSGGIFEYSQN
ncbi:ultraviolet-B receptor UVR8 isoform X2 [Phalaenopsis equestris]|uniref:ultraviolet-B receptor UVR8 isoform X2 n=1 Tax=Phalaenopsis equestris TaxID=78828 RepID=UPI0009E5CC99|nr:ultraviolet-B receptor UVR8 isoform X2 [Phalaenopsis equestris]